jgi:isopentenyldiphosphate isomerase/intracellular septation protein A
MNRFQLLKKILPGFLPLIVFIVVDELYGISAGLIVAVCFGIAQMLFIFIRDKVFDKFTLFDTGLIVILGCVSYILENEIFFKLKPALIGTILCIILGISAFSKMNIMALLSKRYMGDLTLDTGQIAQFNKSTKILFYIFSFHTILVIYSAFFMSKEAWAFISTILFYLLFGAYFLFELIKIKLNNRKYKKEEWLPLVNEIGNITGQAPRSVVHKNKDLLHPVVHLHVLNSRKQLYLQKRPLTKLVQPGKWDTAVGGHVAVNETIENALKREAEEELGINSYDAKLACRYIWKTDIESELVFLFYTFFENGIKVNADEVDEGRFWNISEINSHLNDGSLTPNFEFEFNLLKKISLI